MADKPGILFVNLEGRIAGAERSLLLLLSRLRTHYTLFLACPNTGPLAKETRGLGIRCWSLPHTPVRRYRSLFGFLYMCLAGVRLLRILIQTRPSIVHANNIHAMLACIVPALLTRRRIVWHVRDFSRSPYLTRLCGRTADQIIAVSYAIRHDLLEHGVDPRKIDVVHNGIEELRTRGMRNNATLPPAPPERRFVFANVGQFVPWKNQSLFLQAAARTSALIPHAQFMLVGDDLFERNPDYKAWVLQSIDRLRLRQRTTLYGWQPDMSQVWPRIHCLVHTARKAAFGRVLIEAMDAGVPVIAVHGGGSSEIIRNEHTGLLVPPDSPDELARAMIRLYYHRRARRTMIRHARRDTLARFTASATADQIRAIYQRRPNH